MLEWLREVGVKVYDVFIGAHDVFESMNCGLIVLWVWILAVRGVKCENMHNVRTSASCKPIDAANNALIDLLLTIKIRIEGINGRNGINEEGGAIWCHIWYFVSTLN